MKRYSAWYFNGSVFSKTTVGKSHKFDMCSDIDEVIEPKKSKEPEKYHCYVTLPSSAKWLKIVTANQIDLTSKKVWMGVPKIADHQTFCPLISNQ